jgi:hypothetical protein
MESSTTDNSLGKEGVLDKRSPGDIKPTESGQLVVELQGVLVSMLVDALAEGQSNERAEQDCYRAPLEESLHLRPAVIHETSCGASGKWSPLSSVNLYFPSTTIRIPVASSFRYR